MKDKLQEAMAHLRTIAESCGTAQQMRELAAKGIERVEGISASAPDEAQDESPWFAWLERRFGPSVAARIIRETIEHDRASRPATHAASAPSDEEILILGGSTYGIVADDNEIVGFGRALLARYGAQPAASAEPVAFYKDGVLFWHGEHAAWRGKDGQLYARPPAASERAPVGDERAEFDPEVLAEKLRAVAASHFETAMGFGISRDNFERCAIDAAKIAQDMASAPAAGGRDALNMQQRLDDLYVALEVCSAELFAQCGDQGRAMKYVEQARKALAAEQCARASQKQKDDVIVIYGDGFHNGYLKGRADGYDAAAKDVGLPDVLDAALNNLLHDNYERSYSGGKNREADVALIRAAIAAKATGEEQ